MKQPRRRSAGGSSHQKHSRSQRDHSPPEDLFEGLGTDKMPLLANRKQRTNTETSYGSSRLSFLSRDSGKNSFQLCVENNNFLGTDTSSIDILKFISKISLKSKRCFCVHTAPLHDYET